MNAAALSTQDASNMKYRYLSHTNRRWQRVVKTGSDSRGDFGVEHRNETWTVWKALSIVYIGFHKHLVMALDRNLPHASAYAALGIR